MTQIQVRNPRSGRNDYAFDLPTAAQVQATCERLRGNQEAWAESGIEHRIEVLQAWKPILAEHREAMIEALATDTGRMQITAFEIGVLPMMIDRWCRDAPALLNEPSGRHDSNLSHIAFSNQFVPYQLVGAITPWNFPVLLSFIDAIPALLAGCSVLIKPSEVTPRFIEPLKQTLAALPVLGGVLDIVPGDGSTGAELINNVDAVCFTGSVRTGRIVAEAAARNFIPAFLELGGKDPAIVLESADVDRAVKSLLRASVQSTGQACQSIERIYVARPIYQTFVDKLVEQAAQVQLNIEDIHQGDIGPFIFGEQAGIVEEHLRDAVAKGAVIRFGGEIQRHGGDWCPPTVVTDVDHSMQLMTDETFGPVMPVMPFDTIDEAVALANDTSYGLSGAVFANTADNAVAVARRINAGGISINDASLTGVTQEAEKNSFNYSGMGGSRMGPAGLRRFLRKKALIVNEGEPAAITEGRL